MQTKIGLLLINPLSMKFFVGDILFVKVNIAVHLGTFFVIALSYYVVDVNVVSMMKSYQLSLSSHLGIM